MEVTGRLAFCRVTPGRKRICFVTASPVTVRAFLSDQISALARGHDITVITHLTAAEQLPELHAHARVVSMPIERDIAPWADLRCLWQLSRAFGAEDFDIVHTVTPKAALLAHLAAFLHRIPVRIHVFTGQAWVTRRGPWRWALKAVDHLIAALATHVLVDSPSQRDFLLQHRIINRDRSEVLLHGSICGVNTDRFRPDPKARARIRNELEIDPETVVFLYLGRLNADKGLLDLARAYASTGLRNAALVIVGPDEESLRGELRAVCAGASARLIFVDYTRVPEDFMAAADVFCLPSYREGFGNVIIEAAGAGVPAVASNIYGVRDAVVDGETGLLHPARDVAAIRDRLLALANDKPLRLRLGKAARERATRDFASQAITRALVEYYERLPI